MCTTAKPEPVLPSLERDDFSSKSHPAPSFDLSMILSENRYPPPHQMRGRLFPDHALASCRIAPFRRYGVSEVCHCGGILLAFLLAFAASQKCRSD
jgi:hypothetical protein